MRKQYQNLGKGTPKFETYYGERLCSTLHATEMRRNRRRRRKTPNDEVSAALRKNAKSLTEARTITKIKHPIP